MNLLAVTSLIRDLGWFNWGSQCPSVSFWILGALVCWIAGLLTGIVIASICLSHSCRQLLRQLLWAALHDPHQVYEDRLAGYRARAH